MKTKKKQEQNEPESKPAVDRYNEANRELKEFLEDPEINSVLNELHQLVESRNTLLDEAVRAVKSELQRSEQNKLFVDGIGAVKKFKTYYDAKLLAEHLPVRQFQLFAKERLEYDINEEVLEQLVRQGEVDQVIVREAYHRDEQSPASMPGNPKPYALPPIPEEH